MDDDATIRAMAVEAKCREFVTVINQLFEAGLTVLGSDPLATALDVDGNPWPKRPSEMNAADIIQFIDAWYGEPFTTFAKSKWQLITH